MPKCRIIGLGSGMRQSTPQSTDRTPGFRFRETLLVIGLILVGASVLVLVARRTNSVAMNHQCLDNVRVLGMALVEYSTDHDGTLPPYTNIEPQLAARRHAKAPTNSDEPELLRTALHLYTDEPSWFCPIDPVSRQSKYYLGIRHQFTSYAFPAYTEKNGAPAKLNDVPAQITFGLVWDAAGTPDTCDAGLWFAGSSKVASNHPDGKVNVVLSDLSVHQVPAQLPNGAGVAP